MGKRTGRRESECVTRLLPPVMAKHRQSTGNGAFLQIKEARRSPGCRSSAMFPREGNSEPTKFRLRGGSLPHVSAMLERHV